MAIPVLPAMYSTVPPDAVRRFIEETYLTAPILSCRLLKRGWNDTYEARTKSGRYILRIYRKARALPEVLYELNLIEHANQAGVPAAAPIPSSAGSLTVPVQAAEGERCAVLFEYVDGDTPDVQESGAMYRFGAAAAALHEASDTFSSEHKRPALGVNELLDEPIEAVRPHLWNRPEDDNYLLDLSNRLKQRLKKAGDGDVDVGPCHGDLHTANVRCRSDALVLIDFDFCGTCWRAYDLATFAGIAHMKQARDAWEAFLSGYTDRRPLSDVDLALIPVLTVVRFIWLVGTRVAWSPESGEAWIEGYLDTWFKTLRKADRAMDGIPEEAATFQDVVGLVDGRSTSRRILSRLIRR